MQPYRRWAWFYRCDLDPDVSTPRAARLEDWCVCMPEEFVEIVACTGFSIG